MRDLIDAHRANIAKAGLALAEAINEATTTYTLAVAASEAALEVQIAQRMSQFHGETPAPSITAPPAPDSYDPTSPGTIENRVDPNADRE